MSLTLKPGCVHADAYRQAVELNSCDYRAWYGLGQTYEMLHMPYYALHYFRRATQLRPKDARMWCAAACLKGSPGMCRWGHGGVIPCWVQSASMAVRWRVTSQLCFAVHDICHGMQVCNGPVLRA